MLYEQFILAVNTSSIIILLILAFILLLATRFKGENAYAATIIAIPNIPVYLYNASRMLGWHSFTFVVFPLAYSFNTLLMPLLWLFVCKSFDSSYKFSFKDLIHFIPALLFLILALQFSVEHIMDSIVCEMSGNDSWIGDINTIVVFAQLLIYFPLIFTFLYKAKKRVSNASSDAEWIQKEWVIKFMLLFASLFVVVMVCYVLWPRTDAWLIQILNVVAMFYLVYNSLSHKYMPTIIPQKEKVANDTNTSATPTLDMEYMRDMCERATDYLKTSKAYLQYDLSLAFLAKDMGVSQRNLSRSINGYLNKNFFELVNEMRVEEAKSKILNLDTSGYSIESVYSECGFRSRSTFFLVFKKITGETPSVWLLQQNKI